MGNGGAEVVTMARVSEWINRGEWGPVSSIRHTTMEYYGTDGQLVWIADYNPCELRCLSHLEDRCGEACSTLTRSWMLLGHRIRLAHQKVAGKLVASSWVWALVPSTT